MSLFSELPKRQHAEGTAAGGKVFHVSERSRVAAETPAETRPVFGRAEVANAGERLFDDVAAELGKAVSAELDLDVTLAQIKDAAARVDHSPKTIEFAEAACDANAFEQLFGPAKPPVGRERQPSTKPIDHRALGHNLRTSGRRHGKLHFSTGASW